MTSPFGNDLTGLGRLPQPDKRNLDHPMPTMDVPKDVRRRLWNAGEVLDQGATPQCVGYAGYGWLLGGPVINKKMTFTPTELYHAAQDNDEWPGRDYDGSSTLGLMKALKKLGYLDAYVWATDAETLVRWVLSTGPVLCGTLWTMDMFTPDADDFIEATGEVAGGHEYRLIGADRDKHCPDGTTGAFRLVNSWGRGWSSNGRAWISAATLDKLIKEDGEAVTAVELKIK
jgi:hypothetical protein